MDFLKSKNQNEQLIKVNRRLIMVVLVMFVMNLLMSALLAWVVIHKKTIIVPAVVNQPFAVSDTGVDASYLQQMALFFTYLRFNVTPGNVDFQHKVIENYLDPSIEGSVQNILDQEESDIIQNKISSHFFVDSVSVDPSNETAEVSGTLNKSAGDVALAPETKTYLIHFAYDFGRLLINNFVEVAKNANS